MPKKPTHTISEIPYLIKDWNWEKNEEISPYILGSGSPKKVWWKCSFCGYEWETTPGSRSGKKKHGCPECAKSKSRFTRRSTITNNGGSLATLFPEIAKEWCWERNENTPENIPSQCADKVWWKCAACGNIWKANVQSRTRNGCGCPECGKVKAKESSAKNKLENTGSLLETHPDIASEWDYEKNDITPDSISWHYSNKVHWICKKGHEFQSQPNRRVRLGVGCPICAKEGGTSFPEQSIYYYLNLIVPSVNRFLHKGIEIDVFIPSLLVGVEYDGNYYHNTEKSFAKEEKKNKSLSSDGIRLIRVKESDECKVVGDNIYTIPTKDYDYLADVINTILLKIGIEKEIDIDPIRDKIKILEQYITNEKDNSIVVKLPDIAKQWDYEKNGRIKPEFIRPYTNHKFWWKCGKGHSWEATVASRTNGNGCPCCSGQVLVVGENDLQSQNPELAKEWNVEKNGDLTPSMITTRNGKKVWWKCSECGHEWKTTVAHRSEGKGCPICGRKKSDQSRSKYYLKKNGSFVDVKPELLEEWDFEKNGDLNPYLLSAHNGRKVWWLCKKCGHSWEAYISNRTDKGCGCPICKKELLAAVQTRTALRKTGSIVQTHPYLLEEWDYRKNIIKPEQISIGSDRKVWWKCRFCGYEWESAPNSSNRRESYKKGCPVCQRKVVWVGHNDLATTNPTLASEWNYEKNGELTPTSITDGSNKKVWWTCSKCGNEWQAVVEKRNKGKCNCPNCKKNK